MNAVNVYVYVLLNVLVHVYECMYVNIIVITMIYIDVSNSAQYVGRSGKTDV